MNCLIVDDDPLVCDLLEHFCSKVDAISQVTVSGSGFDAISLIDQTAFDLILLDYDLPDITGKEILGMVPTGTSVIMITSHTDFGHESYNYEQVVDFLVKPIEFPRFYKGVSKVMDKRNTGTSPADQKAIFVKDGMSLVKVEFPKTLYVKSAGNYVEIHTTEGKAMTLMPLKEFEKKLPSYFQRTHRSHIVNLRHIERVDRDDLLVCGHVVPLSTSYHDQLVSKLNLLK